MIKELALGFISFFGMPGFLQIASSFIPLLCLKGDKTSRWSTQCFKIVLNNSVDLLFYSGNFVMLTLSYQLTTSLKLFHDFAVIEDKADMSNL
jgi:hypothetical protein